VFQSLPEAMQKAFAEKDTDLLKKVNRETGKQGNREIDSAICRLCVCVCSSVYDADTLFLPLSSPSLFSLPPSLPPSLSPSLPPSLPLSLSRY
jgi:hypothetical protein